MSIRPTHLVLVGALLLTGSGSGVAQAAMVDTATVPTSARMLTATKARTIAAAGVLRATDMPGHLRTKNSLGDRLEVSETWMAQCVGRKMGPYLTRNAGYTYLTSDLGIQVASSTDVARTLAAARADKATLTSARYRSCLRKAISAEAETDSVEITSFKATAIAPRITGADTTYGYVLDLGLRQSGIEATVQMLVVTSNVRHAEVSLVVSSVGTPVSKSNTYRLLGTAVKRVKRASA